tara:strand:- start:96 stop:257 length:162 start_codon:yes stop_codon:yes gene_type:complete
MTIEGSCFYEHDKKTVKGSFAPYRPYKPFLPEEDDLVVSARLIPCIKKDPKII